MSSTPIFLKPLTLVITRYYRSNSPILTWPTCLSAERKCQSWWPWHHYYCYSLSMRPHGPLFFYADDHKIFSTAAFSELSYRCSLSLNKLALRLPNAIRCVTLSNPPPLCFPTLLAATLCHTWVPYKTSFRFERYCLKVRNRASRMSCFILSLNLTGSKSLQTFQVSRSKHF